MKCNYDLFRKLEFNEKLYCFVVRDSKLGSGKIKRRICVDVNLFSKRSIKGRLIKSHEKFYKKNKS